MHLVLWGKISDLVISGYFVISDLFITGVSCTFRVDLFGLFLLKVSIFL